MAQVNVILTGSRIYDMVQFSAVMKSSEIMDQSMSVSY